MIRTLEIDRHETWCAPLTAGRGWCRFSAADHAVEACLTMAKPTPRSTVGYSACMATGGAQSIPGVTLREAYRFESSDNEVGFAGTVFKKLPRRINWEATIDGTSIVEVGETRREAVELAIAAFHRQSADSS